MPSWISKRTIIITALLLSVTSPAISKWSYTKQRDPMSGESIYFATANSKNSHNLGFPYHNTTARLVLRKHPRHGDDLMLMTTSGQLLCHRPCSVLIKPDNEPAFELDAVGPEDGSSRTLFLQAYSQITERILAAKTLRIEVLFYSAGSRIFVFDVGGFNAKRFDPTAKATPPPEPPAPIEPAIATTARDLGCTSCHTTDANGATPSFPKIAERYRSDSEAASALAKKIRSGATGTWGNSACPPHPRLTFDEALELAIWISNSP